MASCLSAVGGGEGRLENRLRRGGLAHRPLPCREGHPGRHRATAALPVPTPNLQLRLPITGGVDPAQPMQLVLHGIGGREEQLVPYTNLKVPARLVYIRGPISRPERELQLLQD